ncbi:MAG: P-II family nitrogen regulator [Chitinivibrionales bacterium]|nr:P-II family nitrogen regulator [Chitinivibrionales bacterium]MBD3358768.1 P-II family nitrogen regulator [Chitinivibrionales bacterium]
MKEVMAMIRINRINATKKALNDVGITSFTATGRVLGRGKGMVDYRILQGAQNGYDEAITQLGEGPRLVPKRLITVIVSDDWVERTVKAIMEANRTGNAGDGKIFVMPIMEATRVRTGETVMGPSGSTVLDSSGGLE